MWLVLALLACGIDSADRDRFSEGEAETCAAVHAQAAQEADWRVRVLDVARVEVGEEKQWKISVLPSSTYRFVTCANQDATAVALSLVEDDGQQLASASGGLDPMIELVPPRSGRIVLSARVEGTHSGSDAAWVGMALLHK